MKYALIGCGRIAVNHVKAACRNHLEFVAACDTEPSHIDKLKDAGIQVCTKQHRGYF